MDNSLKGFLKLLKMNESTISTILGGLVVILIGVMFYKYFSSINKGKITDVAPFEITKEDESGGNEELALAGLPATYTVQKGDSLWKIAEKFYESGYNYVDIIRENKISKPSTLEVGTKLMIPAVKALKPTVAQQKDRVVKPTAELKTVEGTSYKTEKGDSLWKIALRAYGDGYAWVKIYQANVKLIGRNPSRLYSGVELVIPR